MSLLFQNIQLFYTFVTQLLTEDTMKNFLIIIIIVYSALFSAPKDKPVSEIAESLLKTAEKYHYQPRSINDSFSDDVYNSFLEFLDPYSIIFTKESISSLEKLKTSIPAMLKQHETVFLDSALSIYKRQLTAADSMVKSFSGSDFDFSVIDSMLIDKKPRFAERTQWNRKMSQWIKYNVLWNIQNAADSSGAVTLPVGDAKKKVIENAISRISCRFKFKLDQPEGIKAHVEIAFLKALSLAFDPHTIYMSNSEMREFEGNISKEAATFGMSYSLNAMGEIVVDEVVPGGPAWSSNMINDGDIIVDIIKNDGKRLDMQCVSIRDLSAFLATIGFNQTNFKVRKKNGKIIEVTLQKDLLTVDENVIRTYLLNGNKNIAYIYLPSFYQEFRYDNYFSSGCANDFARELIKLKNAQIDALILDLRDNGGGAMNEAIRIAGSLIDFGNISISHKRNKKPELLKDGAIGVVFSKPIIVMVNSMSASASELLAGVLQDYRRALIVGSRTFGKSTIQQTIPVDAGNFDSLEAYKGTVPGYVKLTTGAFYRVTGETHQNKGIYPDILLPDMYDYASVREDAHENTLKLQKIQKNTYYTPLQDMPLSKLVTSSTARVTKSTQFNYVKKCAEIVRKMDQSSVIPLQFTAFKEYEHQMDDNDDSLSVKNSEFTVGLPDYIKNRDKMTAVDKEDNRRIMDAIRKDLYINESFRIAVDLLNATSSKEGTQ
jgi:carboxyl-terminal processing protease